MMLVDGLVTTIEEDIATLDLGSIAIIVNRQGLVLFTYQPTGVSIACPVV